MRYYKPLTALLAALIATMTISVAFASSPSARATGDSDTGPQVETRLGPYRFRFPKNLFYQQSGPDSGGGVMLDVQWPSLKTLPLGVDYHGTTEHFLSHISIDLGTVERLSDTDYQTRLRRSIEPIDPSNPEQRSHPAKNLDKRVKGSPINGLTPYYVDFEKFRAYYVKRHGADARLPDPTQNDDWFIRMGPGGIPTTFIECSSHLIQDGARIQDNKLVDARGEGLRSLCQHKFLIPEYKLVVTLGYLRVLMPEWQHLESFVRQLLKTSEVR